MRSGEVDVLELTREDARRIAVRAQLLDDRSLDEQGPADVLDVVRRLTLLQVEGTAPLAPSADLVLWSRLGGEYRPPLLVAALADRSLIELAGFIRPAEDLALYRAAMHAWPGMDAPSWRRASADWFAKNGAGRAAILDHLAAAGPSSSRDIPDRCAVPWRSTGWNEGRNVPRMLEIMEASGQVAVAGRHGRDRAWDLAERVHPRFERVPTIPEAVVERDDRRLRALGVARSRTTETQIEPNAVGSAGVAAVVDETRGTWRVDPEQLDRPFDGRAALLSPFDRLVFDRKRLGDLFGFEYGVEIYKPAHRRRWGFYALPVLVGDRLVGKLDAAADRDAGVLRVQALHRDVTFTPAMSAAVDDEVGALAEWLGLDRE